MGKSGSWKSRNSVTPWLAVLALLVVVVLYAAWFGADGDGDGGGGGGGGGGRKALSS